MRADPPRVYLDANVFIAAFENIGAHSDHAWWIIHAIEQGDILGGTSEMTLAEVLVRPLEVGAMDLVAGYQDMIATGPGFEVVPIRRNILVEAARLRARRSSVRLPDAIHVATAEALSCSYIVSDDRRLPAGSDVKVLPVTPFTLDDIVRDRRK